jgi:hypothetical protein
MLSYGSFYALIENIGPRSNEITGPSNKGTGFRVQVSEKRFHKVKADFIPET